MGPGHIRELFSVFGPVVVRRMFGAFGIYADGVMFALAADGLLYLKADEHTIPSFEREGTTPFTYRARDKGGARSRRVVMSYWRLPDRLYDDPEELARWAREACAAAHRAGVRTARRKK
jgi:DNA transformation protein